MPTKNRAMEIVVVHRDRLIREVLTEILDAADGLRVVGWTPSAGEAVALIRRLRPEVVLVDDSSVDLREDGILRALSDAAEDGAIVLLTEEPDEELVERARAAGVQGFATKAGALNGLVDTVRRIGARHPRTGGLRAVLARLL